MRVLDETQISTANIFIGMDFLKVGSRKLERFLIRIPTEENSCCPYCAISRVYAIRPAHCLY